MALDDGLQYGHINRALFDKLQNPKIVFHSSSLKGNGYEMLFHNDPRTDSIDRGGQRAGDSFALQIVVRNQEPHRPAAN